ncbi:amidohydrolase family protein [Algivirga pacifica]|uniref:Amidohydrolase n=1 Tax=Algivirga pacifica TaxID=1162670 RepID=A0ABP9D5P7_9BACT
MKLIKYIVSAFLCLTLGVQANAQVPVPAVPQQQAVLIKGATLHLGNGQVIENGAITFEGGKITYVGTVEGVPANDNYKVIEGAEKHVYPGLILPATDLGLQEIGQVAASRDDREVGRINPEVRGVIAYNTDSHVIPTLRSNGILTAQVTPHGGIFSGTSSIVQMDAWNWEDALIREDDGVHLNWPRQFLPPRWWMAENAGRPNKNYDKTVDLIEETIRDAAAYHENALENNLKMEALKGLFDGSKTLYLHASYAKGILKGVQLAKKHGVKRIVLVGGEEAWYVKDFLKDFNIPVILANVHRLPHHVDEDVDLPYRLPFMLKEAGLLVGLSYEGVTSARNLPFFAGTAATYGLNKEEALKLVTANMAEILGISGQVGTLEQGKEATLLLADGDLLDMRTNEVRKAFIQGRDIDLNNKHKMLYNKFKLKYAQKQEPLEN